MAVPTMSRDEAIVSKTLMLFHSGGPKAKDFIINFIVYYLSGARVETFAEGWKAQKVSN
jgi:hypothetical protein